MKGRTAGWRLEEETLAVASISRQSVSGRGGGKEMEKDELNLS